ncbi:MAG: hypothetical protein L0332_07745 [Chloroflexi bacterium]|nr:hypothetical protein [Chloroflexota bacterium]MCI0575235.1 hypothetical protein [Chloroflexota bacterium]MCI0648844.1 hypothetical protein [Chloroflexota bacterium]MCI0726599.1 hypothetical protein [Chloroflexota bacterium]
MNRIAQLLCLLFLGTFILALGGLAGPVGGASGPLPVARPVGDGPSELFFVRPAGARGPLVAYDMADSRPRFELPAGLLSADGARYYAARYLLGMTTVDAYDPQLGRDAGGFSLAGLWELQALSPTGRWLALVHLAGEEGQQHTSVRVMDMDGENSQVAKALELDGAFEAEAISAAGDGLFLIQHLPDASGNWDAGHYLVRLYDLGQEELLADPLRAKTAVDEVMAGLAWGGVASPDGQWLLTLYLSTWRNNAFIHALNLPNRFPICLALPSGDGDFDQLRHYTLALSSDGSAVYAANPALGVVARINLNPLESARTATFEPVEMAGDAAFPISHSVLSADGEAFYFSGGRHVWAYDTRAGQVGEPYTVEAPAISGLGLSSDGRRLYVAGEDQSVTLFEVSR